MYVVRNYAAQSFELIKNCLDRVEVKKAVFFNGILRWNQMVKNFK